MSGVSVITMIPKTIIHPVVSLALALVLSTSIQSGAQVDATAWTSIEGTTIWARFDGIVADRVILNLRGREYRIPINRLDRPSIAKARRMLDPSKSVDSTLGLIPPKQPAWITTPTGNIEPSPDHVPDCAEPSILPAKPHSSVQHPRGSHPSGNARPSQPCLQFSGRHAIAPVNAPTLVVAAIEAANHLQTKGYKWGGGRARLEDNGYDCSGSVSYVLIKAGLLRSPITSGEFTRYGAPGPGRWITIHARHGHVFMTLCGLRLDTGGHQGRGESGPRWRSAMRGTAGFVTRHPPGL